MKRMKTFSEFNEGKKKKKKKLDDEIPEPKGFRGYDHDHDMRTVDPMWPRAGDDAAIRGMERMPNPMPLINN